MIGAFFLARKAFESEIWRNKPSSWWKIWCFILGSVQHADYKELKRGQGWFNFREIIRQKAIGQDITYPMIDMFMRFAKSTIMLTTQKTTHGVIVTVGKYDLYQKIDTYKNDTKNDSSNEVETKWKRNGNDNINNNDNNVKNEKNLVTNVTSKDTNYFISLFKPINPSYVKLFSNKTQRASIEALRKLMPDDKLERGIKLLPEIIKMPYAPRITTPCELENKLGAYIAFMKQEKNIKNKFSIGIA